MKCPHCLENFFPYFAELDVHAGMGLNQNVAYDPDGFRKIRATRCPSCERFVILLKVTNPAGYFAHELQVWPRGIARTPLPKEVSEEFATDYREACLVLNDSPKASAALSRRCLQHLLREKAGVKKSDLMKEIDQVIPTLPSHLAEAIDGVRNVGNFAAHPLKSTNTGEIIDVEPGEAEWILEVLENLFDFYFVQPAKLTAKRDAMNQKLKEAGKPPMK